MYDFTYVPSDADRRGWITFSPAFGIFAEADFGTPVSVDISTSQGFGQIGVSADKLSVGPKTITIKGVIRRNLAQKKRQMRQAFAPLSRGRLFFGDYEINVVVQSPPAFSTSNRDGKFMLRLLAPHPFWRKTAPSTALIGQVTPVFSFPVNYAEPHQFGVSSDVRAADITNDSDVPVPFSVEISADRRSTNPGLVSDDGRKLRLQITLQAQDRVRLYRRDGIARAELTRDGRTTDVISAVSEDSDLFFLHPGRTRLTAVDDSQAEALTVLVSYQEEVAAVYES